MRKTLKSLVGFLCGILIFHTTASASTTEKLIIRGSDNYPPFEFLNKNGEPEGFNVDLMRKLMEYLKYDYDIQLGNWNKITSDIQNKKIDIAMGMIYSPERSQTVRFTLPTCVINRNIITRKDTKFNSINDIKGKEIVVESGGWSHKYLLNSNITTKIISANSIYDGLKLISSGKHDAMITGDLIAIHAIKELKLNNLKIRETGIEPQNYSIAVNQDKDKLLYDLNIGLQHLKISGEYDQIYNKWFGIYESVKIKESLIISLYVFLSIAILLSIFILTLRRQVAKATNMLNGSKREVGMAIDAGKISAWTYSIQNETITALHGRLIGGYKYNIEKLYSMIHPQDITTVKKVFEAISSGTKISIDTSFRIREHENYPYLHLETKMIFVAATKKTPSHIVGTFKDITKEVNLRLKLEDFRMKSEFIIKSSDIILLQYDIPSKTFIRINANGEDKKSRIFTISQYMEMVHPEDTSTANKFIKELNKGKEHTINNEYRMLSKDNKYDWYIVKAVAYKYDDNGNITSYLGIRRNNTEWKNITNDLILLKEKADASNKLKSAFVANISHEIRTPLNAIIGFSELLLSTEEKEEQSVYMDIIRNNNELLLKLVNDIIDLSRIEAGYIDLNCIHFDLHSYLEELLISLRIKETEQVKLIAPTCNANITICSDRNRISQVIINFVNNAFKFTSKGSVTLDYKSENNGIRISVTDTGIGISDEDQQRVFERFEKINNFVQGAGLGLSICKGIIESLKGKIGVTSKVGTGSTFWFWIPCDISSTDVLDSEDIQDGIEL